MDWTPENISKQKKICEKRIIPADEKLGTIECYSWEYLMAAKKNYADALAEIERQAQEITTLKELVRELAESLSELSNEYCDTEQNHNQYCGKGIVGKYQHKENVCTCGYEEVYVKSRALVQKAQEVSNG